MNKLSKVIRNPKTYVLRAVHIMEQRLSYLLKNNAFFLQGQMDINPRSKWHNPEFVRTSGGFFPKNSSERIIVDLAPYDCTRRDMLVLLLRTVVECDVKGDLAEVGVYKGETAKLIHYFVPERDLYLFDTFEGFGPRSAASEQEKIGLSISESHFSDTNLEKVNQYISPRNHNVIYRKGYFPESIPGELYKHTFAFVHLDADLYEPTYKGLEFFYPRVSDGGMMVIHDYNAWPGARKAVDDFFSSKSEIPIPMPDKSGSALVVKLKKVC